ncbi:maleylacetate reductase [Microbacterium sp. ARD31]|uniref:maleylacetate reductase n=1 Tax=Microbacterium sp. ARD31 TaxID=2962576 RepID=UPI00288196ED|nr:maleylacetate reductase [Microbacterium sp. ARD31]MDT0183958.1 maleylacetate reductase [Microbacterium sp. ARD31]
MSIIFDHISLGQRVLFGTGLATDHAVSAVGDLAAERVLLIADGSAAEIRNAIAERIAPAATIDEIVQHVPVDRARAATDLAVSARADAILTIGGGSATGLAKVVARDTGLPIIAVPTTFAGSEATNVWGQTEGGRKVTGVDDVVLPRVIVYDAALSASLPGALAAASGMNALAHAVDGFWAPRADPINRAVGTESIAALIPGLRALAQDPDDLDARERALYGAYLAAVAFASAGSGMHHKICHVLGGAFNLSHAETHAIVLPYVVAFNEPAAPDAARRVSGALGGLPAGLGLYRLRVELGIAGSLAELGLAESDIPEAAQQAFESVPTTNPRPVLVADIESIIRAAWAGAPIEEDS